MDDMQQAAIHKSNCHVFAQHVAESWKSSGSESFLALYQNCYLFFVLKLAKAVLVIKVVLLTNGAKVS